MVFRRPARYVPTERPTGPIDTLLLLVVVTLVLLGFVVVSAATLHRGTGALVSQVTKGLVGMVALAVGMQLRHTVLGRRFSNVLLGLTLASLAATLVAGLALGAARRWLGNDSFTFQPAELAKISLVIWLASWFSRLKQQEPEREKTFRHSVLIPGLVVSAVVGLTLAQPAVGTSFIMAATSLLLFFIAGVRKRYIIGIVLAAALTFIAAISFISYPRQRWQKFLSGDTYHQEQSRIAIGSGGPVGRGLGEGKQKYFFLPKMHNDFIFAEVGEELGFAGSALVFLLYALLLVRGMRVGRASSSEPGQLLAVGFTGMLFLYALVHVAVTLGAVPTTGQPLPFVSFGGSALVSNLFAAGVLLNVSRYQSNRVFADGLVHLAPRPPAARFVGGPMNRPLVTSRPVPGRLEKAR
jgi:cell division protein FtsW